MRCSRLSYNGSSMANAPGLAPSAGSATLAVRSGLHAALLTDGWGPVLEHWPCSHHALGLTPGPQREERKETSCGRRAARRLGQEDPSSPAKGPLGSTQDPSSQQQPHQQAGRVPSLSGDDQKVSLANALWGRHSSGPPGLAAEASCRARPGAATSRGTGNLGTSQSSDACRHGRVQECGDKDHGSREHRPDPRSLALALPRLCFLCPSSRREQAWPRARLPGDSALPGKR